MLPVLLVMAELGAAPTVSFAPGSPCAPKQVLRREPHAAFQFVDEGELRLTIEPQRMGFRLALRRSDGTVVLTRELHGGSCEEAGVAAGLIIDRHLRALAPFPADAPGSPTKRLGDPASPEVSVTAADPIAKSSAEGSSDVGRGASEEASVASGGTQSKRAPAPTSGASGRPPSGKVSVERTPIGSSRADAAGRAPGEAGGGPFAQLPGRAVDERTSRADALGRAPGEAGDSSAQGRAADEPAALGRAPGEAGDSSAQGRAADERASRADAPGRAPGGAGASSSTQDASAARAPGELGGGSSSPAVSTRAPADEPTPAIVSAPPAAPPAPPPEKLDVRRPAVSPSGDSSTDQPAGSSAVSADQPPSAERLAMGERPADSLDSPVGISTQPESFTLTRTRTELLVGGGVVAPGPSDVSAWLSVDAALVLNRAVRVGLMASFDTGGSTPVYERGIKRGDLTSRALLPAVHGAYCSDTRLRACLGAFGGARLSFGQASGTFLFQTTTQWLVSPTFGPFAQLSFSVVGWFTIALDAHLLINPAPPAFGLEGLAAQVQTPLLQGGARLSLGWAQ